MRGMLVLLVLAPALAAAEPPMSPSFDHAPPCEHPVTDPVVTPIRDAMLDAQRGACMRQAVSAQLDAHALVDTPGFHGVLGADLVLGGSWILAKAHEVSAELHVVDYRFVQNAVNKVTHTGFGPIVLGAAAGKPIGERAMAAGVLRVEVPRTRDGDTTESSAQLAAVVSAMLSPTVVLHARLAMLGMLASSSAGTTKQLAFIAGTDLVWHIGRTVGLDLGADVMAGWQSSFDHLLARTGVHWRPSGYAWRLRMGLGIPVAGAERTDGVLDLSMLVDR